MKPFRYERATDVPSAVATLAAAPDGAFLAAGTNLVDHMRLGIATPDLPVDVRQLTSDRIEELPDGASEQCVATHPSDMAVAMVALDAVVRTHTPDGDRAIPLTELRRLPGDQPERDTVLEHGELITAVDVPPLGFAANSDLAGEKR
jgi:CO/xanthine dehydrogenase FAD-binding subunit